MSQFACKPHDSESAMTEASGGWSGIQVAERRTEGALVKVKRIFSVHDVAEVGFAIEHQDVQDPARAPVAISERVERPGRPAVGEGFRSAAPHSTSGFAVFL